ncbi:MAG TPA: hypothetical protein VK966_04290, partial [Longimicrobiales bacterium]|nr:hypothetical protein [Longimicrobiales bacterium]
MSSLRPRTGAFFAYFASAYPGRTALMVLFLVASGLLEGVSVVTLVPLLELAAAPDGGGSTSGIGAAVGNTLRNLGVEPTLGVLVGLVVGGITAKAILLWVAMRQVGFTIAQVATDLRLQLVRALLNARWSYYGNQPLGGFANSISSEAIRSSAAYREACVVLAGLV